MTRTITTPPGLPSPNVNSGMSIVGAALNGSQLLSWTRLMTCVNSLLCWKAPVLAVDSHDPEECWMGYGYPTGSSYKHRYLLPHPYRDLFLPYNCGYDVILRGNRNLAHTDSASSWIVSFGSAIDGGYAVEVAGGGGGGNFVHNLATVESNGPYSDLEIYLDTFGASFDADNYISCLEIVPNFGSTSAVPGQILNLSDFNVPLFGFDLATMAAEGAPAATAYIHACAEWLRFMYERFTPVFMSCTKSFAGAERSQLMDNATASFRTIAKLRAHGLPSGSPGVGALVYVEDSKNGGNGTIRFTAGPNTTTIPNASLSTGAWCSPILLNCSAGDLMHLEVTNLKVGAVMLFAREGVL